ncbi:hypothetical protein L4D00_23135 [Photobacterium swingsii]|uniref:hypothetical protein n=1 Tax=Photobacterium swingsii TaxID=680026 RepID=UPI003D0EC88B
MRKEKLFDLYEKLYFHEMEVREKIVGRVQVNFALVATGYTIISYMVRMLDFEQNQYLINTFFFLVVLSLLLSGFCLNDLIRAFWGNEYQGIPSPLETDKYREEVLVHSAAITKYNADYPDNTQPAVNSEELVTDYLYGKYRDCSAHNTEANDIRSARIHHSFKWLLISAVPFILASMVFIGGNLDVSSPRKETPISDKLVAQELSKLTLLITELEKTIIPEAKEEITMSDNKGHTPPQPPSQPTPRRVIENDQPERQL